MRAPTIKVNRFNWFWTTRTMFKTNKNHLIAKYFRNDFVLSNLCCNLCVAATAIGATKLSIRGRPHTAKPKLDIYNIQAKTQLFMHTHTHDLIPLEIKLLLYSQQSKIATALK